MVWFSPLWLEECLFSRLLILHQATVSGASLSSNSLFIRMMKLGLRMNRGLIGAHSYRCQFGKDIAAQGRKTTYTSQLNETCQFTVRRGCNCISMRSALVLGNEDAFCSFFVVCHRRTMCDVCPRTFDVSLSWTGTWCAQANYTS